MGATVSGISQSREVKTNMPENDNKAPKRTPSSMSMIEPRFRNIYKRFYKETYYTPTTLDLKKLRLVTFMP